MLNHRAPSQSCVTELNTSVDEVIVRHRALKLYVFSNKIVCCVDGGILIIEFPVWGFMITGNVRELMQSCNRLLGQY